MHDTCGPQSRKPLMYYDQDTSSWRTSQLTFSWDSEPSSQTFPEWGIAHDGELYALPTPVHLTVVRDYSSTPNIPTPTASCHSGAGKRGDGAVNIQTAMMELHFSTRPRQ